jgi:hypothetical protein
MSSPRLIVTMLTTQLACPALLALVAACSGTEDPSRSKNNPQPRLERASSARDNDDDDDDDDDDDSDSDAHATAAPTAAPTPAPTPPHCDGKAIFNKAKNACEQAIPFYIWTRTLPDFAVVFVKDVDPGHAALGFQSDGVADWYALPMDGCNNDCPEDDIVEYMYASHHPTGLHFYAHEPEVNSAIASAGYTDKLLFFRTFKKDSVPGLVPLHRFYYPVNGAHYYSVNPAVPPGFNYEGIATYVFPP